MPHVDDTADLPQRIESGASVRTIAADLGVTERTVRNRLRRARIALPSESRAAGVDLEAVLADYRAGVPVRTIAERHRVGETWVRRRIAAYGVARDVPLKRRSPAPRYAQLADRRWLLQRMADGASVYAVAKELRTGTRTVYDALQRHRLAWPPPTADPVDRLAYIEDERSGPEQRSGSSTKRPCWRNGRKRTSAAFNSRARFSRARSAQGPRRPRCRSRSCRARRHPQFQPRPSGGHRQCVPRLRTVGRPFAARRLIR